MKKIFCVISFLFSFHVMAAKYAVVMGGTAKGDQSEGQEFATSVYLAGKGLAAKGYEVTTIFGQKDRADQSQSPAAGKKRSIDISEDETKKYKKDYDQIKSSDTYSGAMTEANLKKYFEGLLGKINSGDSVEIFLNAHGHNTCFGIGVSSGQCEHEIDISDENGNSVRMKTKDVVEYIKKLEAKGALVNFNVVSCYSGVLQKDIKQLQNACTYLLAAHNSVGYGCMEDDFKSQPPARDFTSVSEAMLFRYYGQISEQLKQDPYLKDKKCFTEASKFHSSTGVDYSSYESTFWGARKSDEALHEPYLSTQPDESFLNMGLYSAQFMYHNEPICEDFTKQLDRFIENVKAVQDAALGVLVEKLKSKVKEYNDSVAEQKRLISSAGSNPSQTILDSIRNAQAKTADLAKEIIKAERETVDYIYSHKLKDKPSSENCKRSL